MTDNETSTTAIAAAAVSASKKAHTESENLEQPRQAKPNNPVFSFFLNVLQSLPLPKKKPEPIVRNPDQPTRVEAKNEETVDGPKPAVVAFPRHEPELPSLKLEAEDADTNTNPVLLWQVYAIGGFFILRWAWARWNERKKKNNPSDKEPPPADD